MPLYSKFLKDMLTRKHKYIHQENIIVEGNCSAVIQKILPPKHIDPGSVTIPCSMGEVTVGKALIDLGASINLMSLSMWRRLEELEIMPTKMTLQLADRSICPRFLEDTSPALSLSQNLYILHLCFLFALSTSNHKASTIQVSSLLPFLFCFVEL